MSSLAALAERVEMLANGGRQCTKQSSRPRTRSRDSLSKPRGDVARGSLELALGGRCTGRVDPHCLGLAAAQCVVASGAATGNRASIVRRWSGCVLPLAWRALPPIEISAAARGPVAVGVLRGRVVLPEGMVESISESALRDVLVHECADVLRRDSWVGLLQRVAGVLFWPHPCVHYLNGQLTRACEEVCDNYVLRCGDPCGYARTLVALTSLCRPSGVTRLGIGLLGARWTLADRVAGLLDPERNSMTRASFRMRVGLGVALVVVVLSGALVQVGVRHRSSSRT